MPKKLASASHYADNRLSDAAMGKDVTDFRTHWPRDQHAGFRSASRQEDNDRILNNGESVTAEFTDQSNNNGGRRREYAGSIFIPRKAATIRPAPISADRRPAGMVARLNLMKPLRTRREDIAASQAVVRPWLTIRGWFVENCSPLSDRQAHSLAYVGGSASAARAMPGECQPSARVNRLFRREHAHSKRPSVFPHFTCAR